MTDSEKDRLNELLNELLLDTDEAIRQGNFAHEALNWIRDFNRILKKLKRHSRLDGRQEEG